MIKINKMSITDHSAAALVSDGIKEFVVATDVYQYTQFYVTERDGKMLESYPRLDATVHSRFAPVFIALQKGMDTCNEIYGKGILDEITSCINLYDEMNDRYSASNIFTYEGKHYVAGIEKDYSGAVPSFTYTVSETNLENPEGYQALHQAIDSEFYPVLADLDQQLEDYIAGKRDEGGNRT